MAIETNQAQIRHVCAHMREVDAEEQFATRFPGDDTPEALARDMIAAMPRAILSVCFCEHQGHGAPATILTAYQHSPGVARLHRISTAAWPSVSREIFSFGIEHFMPVIRNIVHRAECSVLAHYVEAAAILQRLGFAREGVSIARGRDGEDFANFAWVKR